VRAMQFRPNPENSKIRRRRSRQGGQRPVRSWSISALTPGKAPDWRANPRARRPTHRMGPSAGMTRQEMPPDLRQNVGDAPFPDLKDARALLDALTELAIAAEEPQIRRPHGELRQRLRVVAAILGSMGESPARTAAFWSSRRPADDGREYLLRVDLRRPIISARTAGIGASRPLSLAPAKVPSPNRSRALSLDGGSRSSCPEPDLDGPC